jgi:hypothetical protein
MCDKSLGNSRRTAHSSIWINNHHPSSPYFAPCAVRRSRIVFSLGRFRLLRMFVGLGTLRDLLDLLEPIVRIVVGLALTRGAVSTRLSTDHFN